MFIDFEGIDGSGKTTLSNRLAKRLRAEGLAVTHAREGGELPSAIARGIRAMTRDATNLELSDEAELLLYCARDAQVLEGTIRPALARGEVVIADRYLHSHHALAVHGRGLPEERVRAILAAVADGLWPDLVIVVDVDPALARLRKRAGKLGLDPDTTGGRKGLAGPGLLHRLREGFLALARTDPQRFRVIENTDLPLAEVERRVWEAVREVLPRRPAPRPHRPRAAPPPVPPVAPCRAPFDCRGEGRERRLLAVFLSRANRLARREPETAALFLGTARDPAVAALRARLAAAAPRAVARALADRADEEAMALRERLAEAAPREVAASLSRIPGPRAAALRNRLAATVPVAVAEGLVGIGDEEAWALRERLLREIPGPVALSLAYDGSERAFACREEARRAGATPDELLASLAGVDDERGWALRQDLSPRASLLGRLRSVAGCGAEAAWPLREALLVRAPRTVLKGLRGSTDPRAWRLRGLAGPGAREALDSIVGLSGPEAEELRRTLAPHWPAATVSSLAGVPAAEAGALAWELVERWGGYPAVLRAAAQLWPGDARLREAA